MSTIKGQIIRRSKGTFYFISCFGLIIIWGILRLQNNKELINQQVEESLILEETIPAMRGNIYAADGRSLLATSVPYYYVGMDTHQAKNELFKSNIDSLSLMLSRYFGDRSKNEYKELITERRKDLKRRYLRLVNRRISHQEKEDLEKFPLIREGKFKGGVIFETVPTRSNPFNSMALRTVGGLDRDTKTRGLFGIEFSYNPYLAGTNGHMMVKRMAGGVKLPIQSEENVEAKPGMDVVTTIDVNFQDIVEHELRKQVTSMNAKYGTAIVMEIETGQIKAIANLSRRAKGDNITYEEDLNHAIVSSTDPGSTFKLATMMAVLEKTGMQLNDYAGNCNGAIMHRGKRFTCDHHHGDLTVQEVFENSCNIGIYRLIDKAFGMKGVDEFLTYVNEFKLNQKIGFQLKGEKTPFFRDSKDKYYSATTFPWMSIGYESSISPLQMLAFYNSVANEGYWVEPYLVKDIREGNLIVEQYKNRKSSSRIASAETIEKALAMMRGVVENGTGTGIQKGFCKVAGKTGTAQKLSDGSYSKGGRYYTSFIGYFPADKPKYSCLVAIDDPNGYHMFAAKVCAPVFRNIADKIFAYDVEIHPAKKHQIDMQLLVRQQKAGMAKDFQEIADELGMETAPDADGLVSMQKENLNWRKLSEKGEIPDVKGLTLKEALPLLENKGYRVRHSGLGKVSDFSLEGRTVSLVMN